MSDKKKTAPSPACAACTGELPNTVCMTEGGSVGKGCPTVTAKDLLAQANREYDNPETRSFALQASIQEAACYENRHERPYVMQPSKTRIVEICEFADRMRFKRLGLVFCMGLKSEAGIVDGILKGKGFEVISVCCKAGRTSKDLIGIEDRDKIFQGTDESMCNPIFQAAVVNEEKTDLNILLGLCVGHDSLFLKHAHAYSTVLAVKDRVTGHSPLAPIYLHGSYYRKLASSRPTE
ncbi:MAG: DUF1847 domain-containing protein [Pseudomonadota bacterium]